MSRDLFLVLFLRKVVKRSLLWMELLEIRPVFSILEIHGFECVGVISSISPILYVLAWFCVG